MEYWCLLMIGLFMRDSNQQLNNKIKRPHILNKMDLNKKDTQSHQQQNLSSYQSLFQCQGSFQRKKRVSKQAYAEISSFSFEKESEKIVYFDEEYQEIKELIPHLYATSSNAHNNQISINDADIQQLKCHKKGKKITKSEHNRQNIWKKPTQFPPKNQYDKNMFSNITKVIIKKIFDKNCQKWVNKYCSLFNVNYAYFIQALKDLNLQKIRIGTSELKKFLLNSIVGPSVKRVFSILLVDFLQNDFLGYILQEGKMKEPEKYLRCACKMMYIPKLSHEDYKAMSSLRLSEQQF